MFCTSLDPVNGLKGSASQTNHFKLKQCSIQIIIGSRSDSAALILAFHFTFLNAFHYLTGSNFVNRKFQVICKQKISQLAIGINQEFHASVWFFNRQISLSLKGSIFVKFKILFQLSIISYTHSSLLTSTVRVENHENYPHLSSLWANKRLIKET